MANIVFRSLLRKINIVDADRFPKDVPVVLACNHPTAFLEPCILACFIDRPLYFIVRGDFFKNPVLRRMMFGVHLIPIHRMEGGITNIKKNHEIFQYCYDCLDADNTILIMAEGKTRQHKRLGPLKKGSGRIALGFQDAKNRKDALIVPVGVNFTRADYWRTDVTIKVGESLQLRDYESKYLEHPRLGYDALNDDIHLALRRSMIYIERPDDDALVEMLLHFERIHFIDSSWNHVQENKEVFEGLQRIAEGFNTLEIDDPIREETDAVLRAFDAKEIDYLKIDPERKPSLLRWISLIVLFPVFVLGMLTNGASYAFAFWFARRKVKQLEFQHPVRASLVLGINAILWPLLMICSLYLGYWWLVLIYLLKPMLGYFSLKYWDRWSVLRENSKYFELDSAWRVEQMEKIARLRSQLKNRQ